MNDEKECDSKPKPLARAVKRKCQQAEAEARAVSMKIYNETLMESFRAVPVLQILQKRM